MPMETCVNAMRGNTKHNENFHLTKSMCMTFIWSLITLIFVERREDAADKFTQIFSMQSIFSDEKTMFLFLLAIALKITLNMVYKLECASLTLVRRWWWWRMHTHHFNLVSVFWLKIKWKEVYSLCKVSNDIWNDG